MSRIIAITLTVFCALGCTDKINSSENRAPNATASVNGFSDGTLIETFQPDRNTSVIQIKQPSGATCYAITNSSDTAVACSN